jgi:hypothetical protein
MAQGEVLEGEMAAAIEEEGEEPKQVEQESDHRAEIVAGLELDHPVRKQSGDVDLTFQPIAMSPVHDLVPLDRPAV